jgi:hypothetical protein
MTYQIKNEPEDITLQFYYKKAVFTSPYSGAKVDVDIKKVERFADVYTLGKYQTIITCNGR